MKKLFKIFLVLFLISFGVFQPSCVLAKEGSPQYVRDEIIVKFALGQSPEDLGKEVDRRKERGKSFPGFLQNRIDDLISQARGRETPEKKRDKLEKWHWERGVSQVKRLFSDQALGADSSYPRNVLEKKNELRKYYIYKTDGRKEVGELARLLKSSFKEVEFAGLNYILNLSAAPNDPLYSQMWSLSKIQALEAWEIGKGSENIIVAVIDSGVDYNHEDFAGRKFVPGYDYVNDDADPLDDNGHGSHVSGTIAAMTGNAKGISGLNWNVKLMELKVANSTGSVDFVNLVFAIVDAAVGRAQVINLSLGTREPSPCDTFIQDVLDYANSMGTKMVVAAGNEGADATGNPGYLLANCNGVISVAATDNNDRRASYSNYGSKVDLAAPGGDGTCSPETCILSLYKNGQYAAMRGTSMATPHVAGAVALMLALNPNLTAEQVRGILKSTADAITQEPGKPIGAGRLNVYKALLAVQSNITPTITPTQIVTLTPTATQSPTPTPAVTLTPTLTPTPSPSPTASLTPTTTLTPTLTPTATPTGCQASSIVGYEIVLEAPGLTAGTCVSSEYHTNYELFGSNGSNPAGVCRAGRTEGPCQP